MYMKYYDKSLHIYMYCPLYYLYSFISIIIILLSGAHLWKTVPMENIEIAPCPDIVYQSFKKCVQIRLESIVFKRIKRKRVLKTM